MSQTLNISIDLIDMQQQFLRIQSSLICDQLRKYANDPRMDMKLVVWIRQSLSWVITQGRMYELVIMYCHEYRACYQYPKQCRGLELYIACYLLQETSFNEL